LLPSHNLTTLQQALAHHWLSGENATDHDLLPEIKAYLAKARLRRGIEIIKLSNRIEALKMQEDEAEESDLPLDAQTAAEAATTDEGSAEGSSSSGRKSIAQAARGAIFREVVLAKVREAKEQEKVAQVEKDAQAARKPQE
jgi:calcium/calmodulin-dependent protein kinase I